MVATLRQDGYGNRRARERIRMSIHCGLGIVLIANLVSAVGQAQDHPVNGYTYIAPSTYLTPPIMVYDPALVVPTQTVITPYAAPSIYAYPEPVYVAPVWNYGPAPYVRERVRLDRNGVDYRYRVYAPGRAAPVYSYRVDPGPHGVRVRERLR